MKKIFLFFFSMLTAAASHSQNHLNVTLAAHLPYPGQTCANISGYVDSLGNEYALVGASNGLSIVNVTNPSAPFQVIQIPVALPGDYQNLWREVDVWGKYAYVTTEAGGGLQIVDMSKLPGTNIPYTYWTPTINGQVLNSIHALHIDNGKVYLYGSNVGNKGAIIADVATNPMNPIYLGSYDNRYIHDGYVRGDTMYACHIYDGDCEIVNLSNPAAGVAIADFQTPNVFTHNSWLSQNGKIVFTTDETSNSYLTAYDISNLSNVYERDRIQSNPGSNSDVHNVQVVQKNGVDYAVTSWYNDGFTIVDASRPDNLVQVGNYDTDTTVSGSGMDHDWGVYPFLPSGTIVVSDIQNGLFVCTPTYKRACYLEGVVTNCANGNLMTGVSVKLQVVNPQCNSNADLTDVQGKYEVGIATPATYLVVFSKNGFVTDTDTVALSAGVVVTLNKQLCQSPTFIYAGNIHDNSTSAGVAGANVSVYNSLNRWDTVADASGNFQIPTVFSGTYTIASGKWGYVTKCVSNQNLTSTSGAFSMGLDKGIYDDFTWNWGWTASGNATQGMWVRGVPLGTFNSNTPLNAPNDVANDCGDEAFVTGNTGTTSTDDDVDGGAAVLTSPTFDLSSYVNPYIYYSKWKALYGSTDSVQVYLDNGITSVPLENHAAANAGQSAWVNRNYKITSFLTPTSTMKVIVRAVDNGTDDIVEAGFDRFFIVDSALGAVNDISSNVNVKVFPNPFKGMFNVQCLMDNGNTSTIEIYNTLGEKIFTSTISRQPLTIDLSSHSSGIYFYQILNDGIMVATGKLCEE